MAPFSGALPAARPEDKRSCLGGLSYCGVQYARKTNYSSALRFNQHFLWDLGNLNLGVGGGTHANQMC